MYTQLSVKEREQLYLKKTPHSQLQKGQVELANAMLHRFIPKKSSITNLTEDALVGIQKAFCSRKVIFGKQ